MKLIQVALFPLSALVKTVDSAIAPPYKRFTIIAPSCRVYSMAFRDVSLFVRFKRIDGLYVYIYSCIVAR